MSSTLHISVANFGQIFHGQIVKYIFQSENLKILKNGPILQFIKYLPCLVGITVRLLLKSRSLRKKVKFHLRAVTN